MPAKVTGAEGTEASATTSIPEPRRSVLSTGTLYRGREGMWSWVLHRITGVAIYFFLLVHILDTALIRVSPEAYNAVMESYKNPVMGIGELFLVGAVGFHALNGLRIILVDTWSWATKHQRLLFWIVVGVFVVLMAYFTPTHLINVFSPIEEGH